MIKVWIGEEGRPFIELIVTWKMVLAVFIFWIVAAYIRGFVVEMMNEKNKRLRTLGKIGVSKMKNPPPPPTKRK